MTGEQTALPGNWARTEDGQYCLICRRERAGEAALVFQHAEADAHFGASVFWTRRSGAIGGEQAMIEYLQVRREGGQRGIVEIVPEGQ